MQILIDIDEELYNYMQTEEYDENLEKRFDYQIRFAVKDGILLPKKHGRIIDERQITKCGKPGVIMKNCNITRCFTTNAPTIIEADKGGRIKEYFNEDVGDDLC